MSFRLKYEGDEINERLDKAGTALQEHQDISHLATKKELSDGLDKKQDIIEDLESIRENASKGATALQSVPSEYVTESELDEKGFLTEIPDEYVTESELEEKGYLTEHQSIEHLATKEELNSKQDVIDDLASIRDGASKGKTALQSVPEEYVTEQELEEKGYLTEHQSLTHLATKSELEGKVDKVVGKQLSTEDFTTLLKEKLESLKNYDDAELVSRIDAIQETIDTLFSKDASSAIESFNEIITFLEGIEDSQSLDNIIASIEQQIAAVARVIPTKVSELDNDEGYLTEHQDVSGKLDKTEAASTYLTKADAQTTYLGINGKAKSAELADKATQATKATQDAVGRNLTVTYATKAELDKKQNTISDLETIRSGAALGATALQKETYTGTYSKPSDGIPKSDLASAVQASLDKADTALQSVPSSYSPTLDVLKAVYPVGAIYISTVATNPSTLFGFGTWTQIKDRFLLSAGDSYSAGSTGGEATHKLTKSEIPAHTHTRGTMEIYGALTERPCSSSAEILNSKADGAFKSTMSGDDLQWGVTVQTSGQSKHKNNLHEFIASRNWTGETSSVGGGAAHNNMPPYLAVYMWKRTA